MPYGLKECTTEELLGIASLTTDHVTFGLAVGELVFRYKDVIYLQARYVCRGNPALADDVFQNTFLRLFAWLRQRRGKATVHSFPGLLRVFARRAAIDLVRKEGRDTPAQEAQTEAGFETALYARELLETLEGAQQAVVRLTFFEDLSATEIGERLGITPEHVRVIRYRALECIRQRLALDELANLSDPL